MSSSDLLRVEGLRASWGRTPVLRGLTFRVRPSELVVLMGPNGSGKTTLLRCLTGLEPTTGGSVTLAGLRLDGVPTHRRGIGMLSQDPAMFPGRTVAENVVYGLEVARLPRAEAERRVAELLDLLEIRQLAHRRPEELSGGERQRVALARTLAPRPRLVLLDEPFASVDAEFREELRADFRRGLREEQVAAIHVTHDRDEGLFLADRVLVLLDGRIRQSGPPRELFARPATPEVAAFLGYNLVTSGSAVEAIHPEHLRITPAALGKLQARVVAYGTIGPRTEIHLRTGEGSHLLVHSSEPPAEDAVGSLVGLDWDGGVSWPISSGEREQSSG